MVNGNVLLGMRSFVLWGAKLELEDVGEDSMHEANLHPGYGIKGKAT